MMNNHLTEEQLMSPDRAACAHMSECETCSMLYAKNQDIIRKLNLIRDIEAPTHLRKPPEHLMALLAKHTSDNSLEIKSGSRIYPKNLKRVLGLAASVFLCAVLLINLMHMSPLILDASEDQMRSEKADTETLQAVIVSNQNLENQIKLSKNKLQNDTHFIAYQSISRHKLYGELQQIDERIQNAYFGEQSADKKIKLWQQRLHILKAINKDLTSKQIQQQRV